MTQGSFQELEHALSYLEQQPYRHQRAVHFLSYIYLTPSTITEYGEIVDLALKLIQDSSNTITDEPPIYAYQSAALMANLTQPPMSLWRGVPAGDPNSVVWVVLQYYPSLTDSDKISVREWAIAQIHVHPHASWEDSTSRILQYLATLPSTKR